MMQKPIAIGDYVRQTSCPCDKVPDRDGLREVRFISYFCSCFQKFESIVVEEHGGIQQLTLQEFKGGGEKGVGNIRHALMCSCGSTSLSMPCFSPLDSAKQIQQVFTPLLWKPSHSQSQWHS